MAESTEIPPHMARDNSPGRTAVLGVILSRASQMLGMVCQGEELEPPEEAGRVERVDSFCLSHRYYSCLFSCLCGPTGTREQPGVLPERCGKSSILRCNHSSERKGFFFSPPLKPCSGFFLVSSWFSQNCKAEEIKQKEEIVEGSV